jgi:hypothetical protein
MSDTIAGLSPTSDSTYGQGKQRKPQGEEAHDVPAGESGHAASFEPSDPRLIIEDDDPGHGPVFKTIDARTGAVIRRVPSEQVLRLGAAETYVAGQLIKTRV